MRQIVSYQTEKRPHWVGDGFPVRSLLSHDRAGTAASPFLLLDYAGPHHFTPKQGAPRGVGAHPHKGFETVTIVYQGEVEHHDSTGAGGVIGPGDVQWMTAGRGILHQEYHSTAFTRQGGDFEMVQLWVNLPARDKSADPGYQNITHDQIPIVQDGRARIRVIAGNYRGTQGPTRTFTPINVWDANLPAGQTLSLPVPEDHNTTLVLLRGTLLLNDESLAGPQSVLLARGAGDIVVSASEDSVFLLLSGTPIHEPVVQYGPFVMNSETEIRAAIADYNKGSFGKLSA